MSFNFTDKSYILGMWYQQTSGGHINYLTGFWKEDGKWIGLKRKRIVKVDKIFDGNDEKEWTNLTPKNPDISEDEIIKMMDMVGTAGASCGLICDQLLVQGDIKKFLRLAKSKSWMHMKVENIH